VARAVKDHRLETRAARLRLPPSKQPYWREISQGAHVGYFRGKRVGKWVARFRALRSNGKYVQTTIGVADDIEDADGTSVLDFRSAQEIARTWFDEIARGVTHRSERFTVSEALDDYMNGKVCDEHASLLTLAAMGDRQAGLGTQDCRRTDDFRNLILASRASGGACHGSDVVASPYSECSCGCRSRCCSAAEIDCQSLSHCAEGRPEPCLQRGSG